MRVRCRGEGRCGCRVAVVVSDNLSVWCGRNGVHECNAEAGKGVGVGAVWLSVSVWHGRNGVHGCNAEAREGVGVDVVWLSVSVWHGRNEVHKNSEAGEGLVVGVV